MQSKVVSAALKLEQPWFRSLLCTLYSVDTYQTPLLWVFLVWRAPREQAPCSLAKPMERARHTLETSWSKILANPSSSLSKIPLMYRLLDGYIMFLMRTRAIHATNQAWWIRNHILALEVYHTNIAKLRILTCNQQNESYVGASCQCETRALGCRQILW